VATGPRTSDTLRRELHVCIYMAPDVKSPARKANQRIWVLRIVAVRVELLFRGWGCVRLIIHNGSLPARTKREGGRGWQGLRLITVTCRRRLRIQSEPRQRPEAGGEGSAPLDNASQEQEAGDCRLGHWPAVNSINYNNQRHVSCGSDSSLLGGVAGGAGA